MANDNDTAALWDKIVKTVWAVGGGHGVDQLGSALLARHPDAMRADESFTQFVARVRALCRQKGLLDGPTEGASLRALSTKELRELAGVVDQPDDEQAALSLESSRPGARAGLHTRPALTPAEAALSMESLVDRLAAGPEEEQLADFLTPPTAARRPGVRVPERPFGTRVRLRRPFVRGGS
jgi:hypothetical protein